MAKTWIVVTTAHRARCFETDGHGGALFALRDALSALSLALKEWQSEVDHERHALVASAVHDLLVRIASQAGPPGVGPGARSPDIGNAVL